MPSARIHPTALISPEAELADDVIIDANVIIEGRVKIGRGCIVRPRALLVGPLTLGEGNAVHSGAVIGERPQDLKYKDEPTSVEIGDFNIFRENVTIHRGTAHSWTTRIGSHNLFMVNSHVAHDCRVGNRCILANGALLGGHCVLDDNVYLSGNCAVHQFCRMGRLALLSRCSITTKDIPPFMIQQAVDSVCGVNVIGMRRAGVPGEQIGDVRKAFHVLFREGLPFPAALAKIEEEIGTSPAVVELVSFIRASTRGISPMRERGGPRKGLLGSSASATRRDARNKRKSPRREALANGVA
jgi:UDP-N-acetylglucosamine acyltransferase